MNNLRNFDAYRVGDGASKSQVDATSASSKLNGQRIYQNSPKMVDDQPPPLPARSNAPPPMAHSAQPPPVSNGMANGGPNHGVIPFFPFHQFPGRSMKPNRKLISAPDY